MTVKNCVICGEPFLARRKAKTCSAEHGAENQRRYNIRSAQKWYAANSEKAAENNRKWHSANSEGRRDWRLKWRAANSEKVREYNRKWYETNLEKALKHARKWRATNPEKVDQQQRDLRQRIAVRRVYIALLQLKGHQSAPRKTAAPVVVS